MRLRFLLLKNIKQRLCEDSEGNDQRHRNEADQKGGAKSVVGMEPSSGDSRRERAKIHRNVEATVSRIALAPRKQRAHQRREIPFEESDSGCEGRHTEGDRKTKRQRKVSDGNQRSSKDDGAPVTKQIGDCSANKGSEIHHREKQTEVQRRLLLAQLVFFGQKQDEQSEQEMKAEALDRDDDAKDQGRQLGIRGWTRGRLRDIAWDDGRQIGGDGTLLYCDHAIRDARQTAWVASWTARTRG